MPLVYGLVVGGLFWLFSQSLIASLFFGCMAVGFAFAIAYSKRVKQKQKELAVHRSHTGLFTPDSEDGK